MLKILKNLTKKEWSLAALALVFIVAQVWLDLTMPDCIGSYDPVCGKNRFQSFVYAAQAAVRKGAGILHGGDWTFLHGKSDNPFHE